MSKILFMMCLFIELSQQKIILLQNLLLSKTEQGQYLSQIVHVFGIQFYLVTLSSKLICLCLATFCAYQLLQEIGPGSNQQKQRGTAVYPQYINKSPL